MKPEAYERTLKARAFDVARYLLPLATNTSLGQIVNARTLETQVSRLLSSPLPKFASWAKDYALPPRSPPGMCSTVPRKSQREIGSVDRTCGDRAAEALLRPVKTAPTLVKYAAPSDYVLQSRSELTAAAAELMAGQSIDPITGRRSAGRCEPLEVDLATSLLYPHCHYSYRQLRHHVAALSAAQQSELIALGTKHRGRHDELLRAFSAGQAFASTS